MKQHEPIKPGKTSVVVFMMAVFFIYACSANVNEDLVQAAMTGDAKTIERLLGEGADVNAKDSKYHATALMWAAHNGHAAALRTLLQHGAAIDEKGPAGESALWFAAQKGQLETLRILAESGADIDVVGRDGDSAISIATINEHTPVVEYLIKAGAEK